MKLKIWKLVCNCGCGPQRYYNSGNASIIENSLGQVWHVGFMGGGNLADARFKNDNNEAKNKGKIYIMQKMTIFCNEKSDKCSTSL